MKGVVKKTISLQPDVWAYVARHARTNVSAFINEVLRAHRRRQLERAMADGYSRMAKDRNLHEDLELWETALMDGLEDEAHSTR